MSLRTIALASLLVLLPPAASRAADPYGSDEQNAIYALGVLQAQQLKGMLITKQELAIFRKGLEDGFANQAKLELRSQGGNIRALRSSRTKAAGAAEKTASAAFLEQAEKERGAVVTESGLIYLSETDGLGERPTVLDRVEVHYQGTLRDGTVFDSSRERGEPATFALNRVIPCWTEALQKMKVGGKARIICPAEIAYGDRGQPPLIRPGAALTFEVELLAIEK